MKDRNKTKVAIHRRRNKLSNFFRNNPYATAQEAAKAFSVSLEVIKADIKNIPFFVGEIK